MYRIGEIINVDGQITYKRGASEQGDIFKDYYAFQNREGVCYMPETSDTTYTAQDFLDLADGNEELACDLFDFCDWQHPETVLDEWEREGELDYYAGGAK